jgi:hypothetical protein
MNIIRGIAIAFSMGVPICIAVAFLINAISVTLNKGGSI